MFKISNKVRRLTNEEKERYLKDGYLTGLPVFDDEAKDDLNDLFVSLSSRLSSDIDINQTNMWHKASLKFYNLCRTPAILDYVEDLLGPNFFQWGGQFFLKEPKDGSVVPWHQDAQYWPLSPAKSVTVWLALYDTDEENAAMKVVKGSHKQGMFKHHTNKASNLVLDQEVSYDQIKQDDIISSIELFGFQLKVLVVFFTSDKVEISSLELIFLCLNFLAIKSIPGKLKAITKRSNFSSKRSLENFLNFNLLGSLIFNTE